MAKSALNGRSKWIIGALGLLLTFSMGILSGGVFIGDLRATITEHIKKGSIHATQQDRLNETHEIIDRELWPMFKTLQDRMDAQFSEIQKKLEKIEANQ